MRCKRDAGVWTWKVDHYFEVEHEHESNHETSKLIIVIFAFSFERRSYVVFASISSKSHLSRTGLKLSSQCKILRLISVSFISLFTCSSEIDHCLLLSLHSIFSHGEVSLSLLLLGCDSFRILLAQSPSHGSCSLGSEVQW